MNDVRLHARVTPDLWYVAASVSPGGSFDRLAHSADVRHIDNGRGKHNIPNIGPSGGRLQAYHLDGVTARQVDPAYRCCYTFSRLGQDQALYNLAATEDAITDLAGPWMRRRRLAGDPWRTNLDACSDGTDDPRNMLVYAGGQPVPCGGDILVCDLTDVAGGGWAHTPAAGKPAIDPVLGRIAFGSDPAGAVGEDRPTPSAATWAADDMNACKSVSAFLRGSAPGLNVWQTGVTQQPAGAGAGVVATLGEAAQAGTPSRRGPRASLQ